ncbi:MAG: protein-tyrosine phosphatase family protein [Thermodesulfobacteriota bacterium]
MVKERYQLNWVTDSLAVGQAPMSYEDLDSLKNQGIQAIMNLCAEFCDLHWIEADAGFEVYFFPIPDEEAPDLQELEKALDWLDESLYLGKKALVHCRHGIGRTGTVVSAYLLRKGLGHKLAGKKLKGLKSQPVNFNQWWFLRKYGKKEKPLSIREPSLETRNLVDLFPFFRDYQAVRQEVDNRLIGHGTTSLCGQGHIKCCHDPVEMSFIEAIYLNHTVNSTLDRRTRQGVIQRALDAGQAAKPMMKLHREGLAGQEFIEIYRQAQILCPLNEFRECLVFPDRPVACRVFDMPDSEHSEALEALQPELARLSGEVRLAFTGEFPETSPWRFLLWEVVSGKFIQTFFQYLVKSQ